MITHSLTHPIHLVTYSLDYSVMKILELKNVPLYYGPQADNVMQDKMFASNATIGAAPSGSYRSTINGKDTNSLKLELPNDEGDNYFFALLLTLTYSFLCLLGYSGSDGEYSDRDGYNKPFRKVILPSLR